MDVLAMTLNWPQNRAPARSRLSSTLLVDLRNLQKTPENFVEYTLDNYLSMPHNRYIKETEQTFYQKLLPICYQKGIDKEFFFCDNRPINKSW